MGARDVPPCPLCSIGLWDECPYYREWYDKYDGGGEGLQGETSPTESRGRTPQVLGPAQVPPPPKNGVEEEPA